MFNLPFFQSRPGKKPTHNLPIEEDHERHMLERQQFEELLRSFHATRIDDRLFVLDIFLSTERHLTISDLEAIIKQQRPELLDRAFLLETMEMFCQFGFARKMDFETQETRYEHHHLGMHHDHFICTRCGDIQEFANDQLESLQMTIARQFQFHPLQHKMEIYGLCADCIAQRNDIIPLRLAATGEQVRIVRIQGGGRMQSRLADMGLRVGVGIEILNNQGSGPLIVAAHEARLVINAGIAEHIFVTHACRHLENK